MLPIGNMINICSSYAPWGAYKMKRLGAPTKENALGRLQKKMPWRIQNELARTSYKGAYNKKRTCPEARSRYTNLLIPQLTQGSAL